MTSKPNDTHLAILDGLRGAMAFWVFYGHLQIDCIGTPPRWGHPSNAVNVFMVLSGFLMAYHWVGRQGQFTSFRQQTIDFYVRRFFRIAPLYYLLYTIAFVAHHWFLGDSAAGLRPRTTLDAFMHYSFAFGAFPSYVSNNILPDWSIGLEMQFYAIFPLMLLAIVRFGPLTTSFFVLLAAYATNKLFGLYDNPTGALGHYAQPGMILFKIDVFMAGICLAYHWHERRTMRGILWLGLAATCLLQTTIQVQALVAGTLCLLHFDSGRAELGNRILSGRFGRFIGDTSYAVYLLHLMLLAPIHRLLKAQDFFVALSGWQKVGVLFVVVAVPLYGLSTLLHLWIERPGIDLGRIVARRMRKATPAAAMVAASGPR